MIEKKKKKTTYICYRCLKDIDENRLREIVARRGERLNKPNYFISLEYACCSGWKPLKIRFIERDNYLDNYIINNPYPEINKFKAVKI